LNSGGHGAGRRPRDWSMGPGKWQVVTTSQHRAVATSCKHRGVRPDGAVGLSPSRGLCTVLPRATPHSSLEVTLCPSGQPPGDTCRVCVCVLFKPQLLPQCSQASSTSALATAYPTWVPEHPSRAFSPVQIVLTWPWGEIASDWLSDPGAAGVGVVGHEGP
jgi:hypothetical protein